MQDLPKIPAHHWFFRNSLQVLKDPLAFFRKTFKEHGDFYNINSIIYTIFILSKPEYIQELLTSKHKSFGKSDDYKVLKYSLGNGLLISEGEFWKKQRSIAQPAFHRENLQKLVDTMVADTQKMLDQWESLNKVGIGQEMMFLTLEIVNNALFGTQVPADYEKIKEAITIGNEFLAKKIITPFSLPVWFPTPASRRYFKARNFNNAVIDKIIANRSNDPKEHQDLLSMLMLAEDSETGEKMSHRQLRDEAITLFVAGHETTANALSWIFYLLAKNPDKQELLRQEIQAVLDGKKPDFDNLRLLPYTEQVVEEGMRLYPPAWTIGRKSLEETEIGGYRVPKNTTIFIDVYNTHRHPDYWETPDEFLPERFSPEAKKNRHKLAYLPFGAGQRMCIGNNFAMMEMKIVVAMTIQRYRLLPFDHTDIPPEPLITLRPKEEIYLRLEQV
jgi:cytochrome P450